MQFTTTSEEETKLVAHDIIAQSADVLLTKPLIITLTGEMGAGKTRFAKGVAEALGIERVIPSPSYVLTREYHGDRGALIHIDCWRTPDITAEQLEFEQYLVPGTVIVIEWPAPLASYLSTLGERAEVRNLTISCEGEARIISEAL